MRILPNDVTLSGPLTKAAQLLIIPANLPGETGASPWNRHAQPGSAREKELVEKTCAVSVFSPTGSLVLCLFDGFACLAESYRGFFTF